MASNVNRIKLKILWNAERRGKRQQKRCCTNILAYTFFCCLSGTSEHKGTQKALFYCFITCWFSVKGKEKLRRRIIMTPDGNICRRKWKISFAEKRIRVNQNVIFLPPYLSFYQLGRFAACRSKQAPKCRFMVDESWFTKIDTCGNDFGKYLKTKTLAENFLRACSSVLRPRPALYVVFPTERWQQPPSSLWTPLLIRKLFCICLRMVTIFRAGGENE